MRMYVGLMKTYLEKISVIACFELGFVMDIRYGLDIGTIAKFKTHKENPTHASKRA